LKPFWELLWKRKKRIKVAQMDMGAAFQKAVKEYLPNAKNVVDHFHVVKLMNDKTLRLRRMVILSGTREIRCATFGTRYLL
jgi:transposase